MKELLFLFIFNLKTTFFRLFEWIKVVFRYYRRNLLLLSSDTLLASRYVFKSPHRISKEFAIRKGEKNIYNFGETPLTTLDRIARECRIMKGDRVYELGCGSGRTCFWLHFFIGCSTVGIDFLPTFIQRAEVVARTLRLREIKFICEDMLQSDLTAATVIYLYGTCLEDALIEQLIQKFIQLKPGTKIITVSFPLTEYHHEGLFQVERVFTVSFPWGKANVFLNRVLSIRHCITDGLHHGTSEAFDRENSRSPSSYL